ncbi:hypothetical protein [Desulfonema magnum]|uniref:hypothetical protein n=1 Tax=Desulfonema magnum TaxID=45655 RepID=UPI001A9B70D3|nr:hypothetical protein [Desulfonema magnum]
MFSNFIYFIIVLLIYTTYQPTEETNFSLGETCIFFIAFIVAFASFCRLQFHKLEKRILRENFVYLDHQFSVTLSRQFIMSIMLFAIDIYGLNLPSFFIPIPFFSVAPTIQALIFLLLFTFYLAIVWGCAYDVYQKLYPADISRRSYIQANISLAVPVLLPWFLLSIFTDLIKVLPYAPLRIFFSTTEGEVLCFLVFLFLVVIIGPDLVRRFWRCKPLKPGYHRKRIENLCRKAGLEYANILYWPMFGGG